MASVAEKKPMGGSYTNAWILSISIKSSEAHESLGFFQLQHAGFTGLIRSGSDFDRFIHKCAS
jgi:hypothetical protein